MKPKNSAQFRETLRAHVMVQPRGSMERNLLVGAADVLDEIGDAGLDTDRVVAWLEAKGVSLIPWQRQRLGLE